MNFIVPLNHLEKKLGELKKFTTFQEKNALFVEDHVSVIDLVKELTDVTPISEEEADLFLLKLREISVSDVIEVIVNCTECDAMNTAIFEISDLIDYNNIYYKDRALPRGIFSGIEDILGEDAADNLPLKDYTEIENLLLKQNENILCDAEIPCRKCSEIISIYITPRENFSKSSAGSIYQEYVDISIHTNNGKMDIDSMYPYEREMFISIITDKLKKND